MHKVSVITPSTPDRDIFAERMQSNFFNQDYKNIEWIIIENDASIVWSREGDTKYHWECWHHEFTPASLSIGSKRNDCCELATGDIILHMDSDDLYAPDYITRCVNFLQESKADIIGLSNAYFYKPHTELYELRQRSDRQLYLCEATLCYWRSVWERKPFKNIQEGEGLDFISNNGRIADHGYKEGFVAARITTVYSCHKSLSNSNMFRLPDSNIEIIKQRFY